MYRGTLKRKDRHCEGCYVEYVLGRASRRLLEAREVDGLVEIVVVEAVVADGLLAVGTDQAVVVPVETVRLGELALNWLAAIAEGRGAGRGRSGEM